MDVYYPALGLANEAGETAGKVKKAYRDDGNTFTDVRRAAIADELGDTLWYLSAVAHDLGYSLGDIAIRNHEKVTSREQRGAAHGDGDNR